MKNETGTLCKSYFHLSQFSEFAKLNSASCEFGVEITFSNEVLYLKKPAEKLLVAKCQTVWYTTLE